VNTHEIEKALYEDALRRGELPEAEPAPGGRAMGPEVPPIEAYIEDLRDEGHGKPSLPMTGEAAPARPEKAPAATHLRLVALDGLLDVELPAPEFAVEQLIPVGEVTLLGGHGGAGKSIFALTIAAHFAAYTAWAGLTVQGGRALYVSLEDPAEIMRFRLKKIIEAHELDGEEISQNLTILDGSEGDGSLMAEVSTFGTRGLVETSVFEELKRACAGYGLIVIDNASDAFAGDENSRRQVRKFIRALRDIARRENAGLVLLCHIDKSAARYGANGNSYSGSTAWHNSVRSRLVLLDGKEGVELRQEKLNLGARLKDPLALEWENGVLMTRGILSASDIEDREEEDKAAVLEAIRAAIQDGENVSTARTGPTPTQAVLERYPDLPDHLRGKKGRAAFYTALTQLQRSGVLAKEEYLTPARHTRERYALKGC